MTDVLKASHVPGGAQAAPPGPPTFGLTKFADPLRIPPVVRPHSWGRLAHVTVRLWSTQVQLHSQLPPTTVWAYDGHFPGPTIEVHRKQRLRVAWKNEIEGPYPLVAVRAPISENPSNSPGYNPATAEIIEGVADLPAWLVTHLHGAETGGGNDGWPHNAFLKGDSQLAEYPNDQPATALWYHDHAMNITRWNVHTGLAGMYLIRDDEEDALRLPRGRYEVPLLIADRNLDTDEAGNLTGQLLYKVALLPNGATLPFTGPFTLVNGVIWPHLDVEARWYRFRVVNTSNDRQYQLDLIDEQGRSQADAVRQIGTDGGLLPEPTPLPAGGLILTPAERADLLVDFSRFCGQRLRLTNVDAPPERDIRDIMEFRVSRREAHDHFELPKKVSKSYYRVQHGTTLPETHDHKWVALVPPGTSGDAHPEMWELAELTDPAQIPTPEPGRNAVDGIIQIKDPTTGEVRTFQRVASDFDGTTTFFIHHGDWSIWNFIHIANPAPGAPNVRNHPMHIHLTQFQALRRDEYDTTGFNVEVGGTVLTPTPMPLTRKGSRVLEKYEEGWKDTIRVDLGDLVSVAGQFAGGTGNFVYHCHILEHEDEGMMRPFVVMPAEVMAFGHLASGGHRHDLQA